jgi:hypothetical protein
VGVKFVEVRVCGILQGCVQMTTTAFQQLTILIAHCLVVQVAVDSSERVVERCALRAV